jgi:beta-glucosidase
MSQRVEQVVGGGGLKERAAELVAAMSVREQTGLLFHPMVFLGAELDIDAPSPLGPSLRELIVDRGIRMLCLGGIPSPSDTARVTSELQALARSTGSRAPLVFSTDPRHSFVQNDGAAHRASGVSQWPELLGFGALGDADAVREFADVVRQDYVAMGIRMALHPQVDLTTEPRWARQAQSFGATPELTSRLLRAYLEGIQGAELGHTGVAATTKHFPGGGPQRDGEDPHFEYGREQVYPGGRFADHLAPFRTAIDAGTAAIMPYYGMPVGLELDGQPVEEVGFAFNRRIMTELLREEMGFDGLILSDFGLITDAQVFGKPFPARAWGVEHLSRSERLLRLIEAGIDQFGGEFDTELLHELVASGQIEASRVTESAERVVELQLRLGLWDSAATTDGVVGGVEQVRAGVRTQARASVILDDARGLLPLRGELRVALDGLAAEALPEGWNAASPNDADVVIVRLSAPFEPRDTYFLESSMEQGSLEFSDEVIERVSQLAEHAPVIVVVTLTRPAILTPLIGVASVMIAEFGASDEAIIDVLSGAVPAEGRLPFELPRSMAAVRVSSPDVASDTADPLFAAGSRSPSADALMIIPEQGAR